MTDLVFADVSHWQGDIDWPAYAATSPAAIAKATEGASKIDERFPANQAGMRAHLPCRGWYHFYTPGVDPIAQARHFAGVVGDLLVGEFAVIDVEQGTAFADYDRCAAEVDRLLGGLCWLYGGQQVRTGRPLWVARYAASTPVPEYEPHVPHVLWQYTDAGRHAGIAGRCDLNIHRGDLASLLRFTKGDNDMPTADEIADAIIRKLNAVATGKGQTTYGGTVKATLATAQALVNAVNGLAADLNDVQSRVVRIDGAIGQSAGTTTQYVIDGRQLVTVSVQPYDPEPEG